MSELTDSELLEIIQTDESDSVEFKELLSGSTRGEIRAAICAFANDLPNRQKPGLIFVGVRSDRTFANLLVTDELLRNLADMKTDGNILPPPSMTVEKRLLQDHEVAVISVQPSDSPPVRYRGMIRIRIGPRRGIATAQDERILNEKRLHGDRPFDIQPVPGARLSDLNLTQFENEYLTEAFAEEVLDANDRSLNERLAATKMIATVDEPVPTVMGLLAIGKSPQDFFPGAYIQFLKFDGLELTEPILDAENIAGTIPDILRRLDEKIMAHNRTTIEFTNTSLERRLLLYPIVALQQIIRNAVMHRTYESTNSPVHVYWYNDRVEVTSPGGAFGIVTADNFGQPGFTDYRNPNLAEAMRTLGFVQRFGVGIPTARRQLELAGHEDLRFEITDYHVNITIPAGEI